MVVNTSAWSPAASARRRSWRTSATCWARAVTADGRPSGIAERVSLYYGVRTADLAAGFEDFRAAGAEVHLASDDGSLGFHGYVTQLLEQHPSPDAWSAAVPNRCCTRWPGWRSAGRTPCHVSLETPMACGVGVCFSCVTRVRTADGWDYRRVCVDGPVFDAAGLAWDAK